MSSNIGWLFYKYYYSGLQNGMIVKDVTYKRVTSDVIIPNVRNVSKGSKEEAALKKFFDGKNDEIKRQTIECQQRICSCRSFVLQTQYPGMLIGSGNIHETGMIGECKLGLQFDYTTGLPYIPGSSVKGLLRSMFPYSIPKDKKGNWTSYRTQRRNYIKELAADLNLSDDDVEDLEMQLFSGKKKGNSLPMSERCIFYDAMISGYNDDKGILDLDYITPHNDPLKNPTPIQFMKILPEVQFQFQFRIPNKIELTSGVKITQEQVMRLFQSILLDIGIGAKTNVGYGQLRDSCSTKATVQSSQPKERIEDKEFEGKLTKIQANYTLKIEKFKNDPRTTSDLKDFGVFDSKEIDKKLKKNKGVPIDVLVKVELRNNKITQIKSVKVN